MPGHDQKPVLLWAAYTSQLIANRAPAPKMAPPTASQRSGDLIVPLGVLAPSVRRLLLYFAAVRVRKRPVSEIGTGPWVELRGFEPLTFCMPS
jgi:hypothetical protein